MPRLLLNLKQDVCGRRFKLMRSLETKVGSSEIISVGRIATVLFLLVQTLFLSGCKDTGGQVIGYVNGVLNRATLSASSSSVTLNEGSSTTVTIRFNHPITKATTLDWSVNATTSEFSAVSGTITVPLDAQSVSLVLTSVDNAVADGTRAYTLSVSGSIVDFTNDLSLSLSILDDESAPVISIADASVVEGTGAGTTNLTFTITASRASSSDITVDYATSDGTATAGSDYTSTSGTATITAGNTTTTVSVPITRDAISEGNETFTMSLSGGSGYTVSGSTLSATGTIIDDDSIPTISIADVSVAEGTGGETTNATLTITASGPSSSPITVNYATSDGTATTGSDYTSSSGTATIATGDTTTTISVPITRDSLYESDETFTVTLSGGSGYTSAGSTLTATVTITDDDTAPTISIANVSQAEGNSGSSNMTFTITAAAVSGQPISVNYATSNGTATAGSDYTATSGTATITAGSTTTTVNVPISGDTLYEADETFTVTLSGGSGYTSAGSTLSATGTITNDDTAPTISIANVSQAEGNSGSSNMTFTITASAVSGQAISINYATGDGTATAGSDYTATSGTATITAGSTTTTINIPISGDTTYESDETFTVTLSGGSGYTSAGSTLTATGTITNDDLASMTWNFATASDYTYDTNYIDLSSGTKASLKTVNTTFNDSSTFNSGTHVGTAYESGVLKLDSSTHKVLSSSWTPQWSHLIAYFKFENDWVDTIGGVGTLSNHTGNSLTSVQSKIGTYAALMATSDNARTPSDVSFDFRGGFSVSAWVYPNSSGSVREVIKIGNSPNVPLVISLNSSANTFSCLFNNSTWVTSSETARSTNYVGRWTHVSCIFDPSSQFLKLYVNSELRASTSTGGIVPSTTAARPKVGGDMFWDGYLDDIAIWNCPLTQEEIKTLYSGQGPDSVAELSPSWTPKWSSLVGYWKMDGNWLDSSGNGNNGVLSSGTSSYSTGKVGPNAGYFDGATKVATTNNAPSGNSSRTFTLWANRTSTSTQFAIIGGGHDSSGSNWDIRLSTEDNAQGCLTLYLGTGYRLSAGCGMVPLNTWNHLAVVLPNGATLSSQIKFYVNGVQYNSTLVPSASDRTINTSSAAVTIGGDNDGVYSSPYIGYIDDIAIWSTDLSSAEIALIYDRQKQKYAGSYDSPIVDMGASGAAWTSLASVNTLPFFKELPGNSGSESSSNYSSIGGTINTSLVGLWHLNETSGTSLSDSSGSSGGAGSLISTPTLGLAGILNNGIYFPNDRTKYVSIPASATLNTVTDSSFTFQAWYYPYAYPLGADLTDFQDFASCILARSGNHMGLWMMPNGSFRFNMINSSNTSYPANSSASNELRKWYHLTGVFDASNSSTKLFLNGNLVSTAAFSGTPRSYSGVTYKVGTCASSTQWSGPSNGIIDEVAIWSRALSAAEVLELYRRGANRVKYQARSCVDSSCACKSYSTSPAGSASDCDGDGIPNSSDTSDSYAADWIGPDGTASTYFSELQNNTSVDASGNPTGSVNTTGLTLDWSGSFFTAAARPTANRYFQYRVYMESDDENNLCSGSPCMPEVTSITVGPTGRYYGGSPTVVNNTALSFNQLQTMTRSDTGSCTTYQLSTDGGSTWKWWDGSSWAATSGGVSSSNYLSDFTTPRLQSLSGGNYKFKAFLNTNTSGDFTQSCDLNSIGVTYTP